MIKKWRRKETEQEKLWPKPITKFDIFIIYRTDFPRYMQY